MKIGSNTRGESSAGINLYIKHQRSNIKHLFMPPFLKYWLPPLAWMIFIFAGSTDLLSAGHTSRFIGPFLRWFAPDVSDLMVASIQLVVRKLAHLSEYTILAALLLRALRRPGAAFVVTAIYATVDEFHQSFVASRTGSPWDVAIDCAGALIGLALWTRLANRKSRIENPKCRE